MYNKLGQACVTNWGSFVLLQTRATVVTTNWGKTYKKFGQVLQIGAYNCQQLSTMINYNIITRVVYGM